MAEWLSSWLVEQEVRDSIPCLATWISEIGYLLLPSRDMAEIPLKNVNSQYNQPTLPHGTMKWYMKFDLLLNNLNIGCYLVMVGAQRASLSSDNSYYLSYQLHEVQ